MSVMSVPFEQSSNAMIYVINVLLHEKNYAVLMK